jgi:hypothetical protein
VSYRRCQLTLLRWVAGRFYLLFPICLPGFSLMSSITLTPQRAELIEQWPWETPLSFPSWS